MSPHTVPIRLSEVLSALTYALDITEALPEGHAIRTCMLGMSLADYMDLSSQQRSALYYALLLKDLGCSSNAARVTELFGADDRKAKRALKTVDWTSHWRNILYTVGVTGQGASFSERIRRLATLNKQPGEVAASLFRTRCERGSDIARQLGFPEETAQAILDLDEHWDGKGQPLGKKGQDISLLGRILCFAQTLEVFHNQGGPSAARKIARRRSGTWFDPGLVRLFFDTMAHDDAVWAQLHSEDLISDVLAYEPRDKILHADQDKLDRIAEAFARVIDAKSPYTGRHSARVAEVITQMAVELRLPEAERRSLSRAALLHDIGKLAVPNTILDKRGELTQDEWVQVRAHTEYTYRILKQVRGFSELAAAASAHHERLDGKGYHRGLPQEELSQAARLLAVADQYEALTAARPYRAPLSPEQALQLLEGEVGTGIDGGAFEALQRAVARGAVPAAAANLSRSTPVT